MPRRSAGVLMYKRVDHGLEVLLVHPGGPFWARKDLGAWSIPKGEYEEGEDPLAAAVREFREETGAEIAADALVPLGEVKLRSGKVIMAWGLEGDFDVAGLVSNTFETEWPPKSGKRQEFPEVDRAEWFEPQAAKEKLNSALAPLVDRLIEKLSR